MDNVSKTVERKESNCVRYGEEATTARPKSLVYVRYRDHVLYHRGDPTATKPQTRECVGWLVYEGNDYVTLCWDRDAGAPTLRGGDPKASGLVVLRSDILELKRFG